MIETFYIDVDGTLYKTLIDGNLLDLNTGELLIKFTTGSAVDSYLLMETGDFLLMESGDKLILDGV
jgi:hypothetical protein